MLNQHNLPSHGGPWHGLSEVHSLLSQSLVSTPVPPQAALQVPQGPQQSSKQGIVIEQEV